VITVTDLVTYPVKSCAGVQLVQARVTRRGLEHDRDYMLVDDDNDFVFQRKVPELAVVVPTIGDASIGLSAPGMPNAEIPLGLEPDDDGLITATVHGRPVAGQLIGEHLDEWFTSFLPQYKQSTRYRLLRIRDDCPRYVKELYQKDLASNQLGFADANSLLLATEPSLARLNEELEKPVPMNRFRPNIVLDGDDLAPYDEDYWLELRIGALAALVVKACGRCVIPDTDQDTAVVGKAVRRALRTRTGTNAYDEAEEGVFFAQNLSHVFVPGTIVRLGDNVQVLSRATRPNVRLSASVRAGGRAVARA
jgi:uncharacterized protein YcbX